MSGLLGKKIGMTSLYDENGKNLPCTVIQAGPCVVTQVRTKAVDGYEALQLGFDDKSDKNTSQALKKHFEKAGTGVKRQVSEFKFKNEDYKLGDEVKVDVFEEGQFVDISGNSKGKGFQGVVKRHGFRGVGDKTHGQGDQLRAGGSIGGASDPSRVFKGVRMAGQMGDKKVKVQNLRILKIDTENNLIVVKGCVPGHKNAYLKIER
ncbi:MAG: 50S ribosomal protein L3 [Psychroflexus sp.]|nr:50S ribosomal protein L3 [Psychroflexus sp.]MDR9447660.1 50S ribosomal protein L3 [Psychroflexus sp.]